MEKTFLQDFTTLSWLLCRKTNNFLRNPHVLHTQTRRNIISDMWVPQNIKINYILMELTFNPFLQLFQEVFHTDFFVQNSR